MLMNKKFLSIYDKLLSLAAQLHHRILVHFLRGVINYYYCPPVKTPVYEKLDQKFLFCFSKYSFLYCIGRNDALTCFSD